MNRIHRAWNVVAVLLAVLIMQSVHAKSPRQDLAQIDAFHPPVAGADASVLYKEWHYFSMTDKTGKISYSAVLSLEGDVSDPVKSYALDIQNFSVPIKSDLTLDVYPIDMAAWSDQSPDLRIGRSEVSFDGGTYRVYTESADGKTIFDARWIPEIEPEKTVKLPVVSNAGDDHYMNWLLTSAKMRVDGTLTVNKGTADEKTYSFKDARGYHDHNWGYWDWADDMGWDWGQAVERESALCAKTKKRHEHRAQGWFKKYKHKLCETHSLALLNMTDGYDTESSSAVIKLWKGDKRLAVFNQNVQVHHKMMYVPYLPNYAIPEINFISGVTGNQRVDIVFVTENYAPIYLPIDGGYRIIWELTGKFFVSGYVNKKKIWFVTEGSMEYFGAPLLN
ncbi:MAG TPA: hypothetical protein VLE50_12585 [Cellvibrio sp.]|nr:hypothetical protein [Cellvibrio sp.]